MSYGANPQHLNRRTATYVDQILKGPKPADLPVEQPTEFRLYINLKTANQLGITIPLEVMLQAYRVYKYATANVALNLIAQDAFQ